MGAIASALLGMIVRSFAEAFGRAILDLVKGWERDRIVADAARTEAERDQALAGKKAERDMADIAARRDTEDDILSRLEKGTG